MTRLRSPAVHHLGGPSRPLRAFARPARAFAGGAGGEPAPFAGPYRRPSLALFDAHVDEVLRAHALDELRLVARAGNLAARRGDGLRLETDAGALDARRVVLAVGGGVPHRPAWAHAAGGRIEHILDPALDRSSLPPWSEAVVVGGGLSAVETASSLAAERPGHVTLLHRHALRVRDFDSDPGWLGPRRLRPFHRASAETRRRLVDAARSGGSVPPAEAAALRRAEREGRLRVVLGEVGSVERAGDRPESILRLRSAPTGSATPRPETLRADLVLLATGLDEGRSGAGWLDAVVRSLPLSCAPCGSPRLDAALQWAPGLHVSGPLAELEIGPLARNIAGALFAAERLLAVA
jgi:hypothetical protein